MMDILQNTYKKYPTASVVVTLSSAYALYYALKIAHKPRLFCNGVFGQFLLREMQILSDYYRPTFWGYGAILQTVLRTAIKYKPPIQYRKEFLSLSDGGHVALDWVDNDGSEKYADSATRPTVILLPGLIGSSKESYMLHFAEQAIQLGYRCVVFNNRGNGGAELKTARTYCASNTEDLGAVVTHIHALLPRAPLMAAGVSLGGIILANYLTHRGDESGLQGAFTVSMAWDLAASTRTLEQPLNHFLFNSYLCSGLKANVEKNRHFFKDDHDLDYLMQSRRIRDFDDRFVAKQFGYASWREYYAAASMHVKLGEVRTPLLTLNAADDPFAPEHSLPCSEAEKSSHVAMVVTKHGGHIGFLEGWYPRYTGYVDRLFAQWIQAVFENGDDLNDMLNKQAEH